MNGKKISPLYKAIKWLVKVCYSKVEVVGTENLPDEPVRVVGNHTQMNGPIACELYFPGKIDARDGAHFGLQVNALENRTPLFARQSMLGVWTKG